MSKFCALPAQLKSSAYTACFELWVDTTSNNGNEPNAYMVLAAESPWEVSSPDMILTPPEMERLAWWL